MAYKDPEQARIRAAAYYMANRERIYAYREAHREEILSYGAEWRAKNADKRRADNAAWCATHPEEARAHATRYRAAHRAEITARRVAHREEMKAYQVAHRPEFAARDAKRRAIKRSSTVGDMTAIKAIYRQAKENKRVRCYLCGKLIPMGKRHVDHIMPLSKGGEHRPSNLAIACVTCNKSKSAKHPNAIGLLL
jgi:5-methylcytosine-specific restriction endonuclease McrA